MDKLPSPFYTATILSSGVMTLRTETTLLGARVKYIGTSCLDPRQALISDDGSVKSYPTIAGLVVPYAADPLNMVAMNLATSLIVNPEAHNFFVMGHSDCRGMKILMAKLRDNITPPPQLAGYYDAMFSGEETFYQTLLFGLRLTVERNDESGLVLRALTKLMVLKSSEHLLGYLVGPNNESVAELIDMQNVSAFNLVPVYNRMESGEVHFFDPESDSFVVPQELTNTWAERFSGDSVQRSERIREVLKRGQINFAQMIYSGDYSRLGRTE